MTIKYRAITFYFFSLALFGCAPKTIFYWGDYEDSLYARYMENNSEQAERYLNSSLNEAANRNKRVPPGVYADYGFLLYQRGDKNGAINFFEKEKQLYPEAQTLMSKLIERIKQQIHQEDQKTSKNIGVLQ